MVPVERKSNSNVRDLGFDIRSGNILSFLFPLIQEEQLSVTGESVCTKYYIGVGRGGPVGGGRPPPNNFGGGQHTLCPPPPQ